MTQYRGWGPPPPPLRRRRPGRFLRFVRRYELDRVFILLVVCVGLGLAAIAAGLAAAAIF